MIQWWLPWCVMSGEKDNLVCRRTQHSKLPPHEVLLDKHPQHGDHPEQNFLPDFTHHIHHHHHLAPTLAPRGVGGRGSRGAWRRNPLQRSYLRIQMCPGHPPGLIRGLCYRLLNIATNPHGPGGSMTMEINSKVISVFGFALIPPRATYCHFRPLVFLYLTCLYSIRFLSQPITNIWI